MISIAKKKFMTIAEDIHLRVFGHEMSGEMLKFVGNLGWMTLGMGISIVLLFFVNLAAARLLGPSEYGKYTLIISVGQLFIIPMSFGFNTAAIKYLAENSNRRNMASTAVYSVTFFSIVSAGMLWLLKDYLAPIIKIDQAMYLVAILYGLFLAVKYIYESLLRGTHRFKLASFIDVVNSFVIAITFFGCVFFSKKYTFQSYIFSIIAGLIVYIILSFFRTRKNIQGECFEIDSFKRLFSYGWYATLGSVGGFIVGNASQFVLNNYLGFSVVGLFAVYSSASTFLTGQLTNVFINVFFPSVSAIQNKTVIVKKIKKLFVLFFVPLLLLNSLVIALIVKMYGSKFEFNLVYVFVFSMLSVLLLFQNILWWLVASYGKKGIKFTSTAGILTGLVTLLLLIILVKNFGIMGAAVSSIFTAVLLVVLSLIYFKKNEIN